MDAAGNAYITGSTESPDFPLAHAFQSTYHANSQAFVTKLNATGSALLYSTFLGGSTSFMSNSAPLYTGGAAIAVDPSGEAMLTGETATTDFPTANALYPVPPYTDDSPPSFTFVTKFSADGSHLLYSTYLGGDTTYGNAIATDAQGNAYIGGEAISFIFPVHNAIQPNSNGGDDAFITKLNPTGSALVYSTYLGGSSIDAIDGLACGPNGDLFVTGITYSKDFPTANALYSSLANSPSTFVARLNPAGSALTYSTYFPASYGSAMAVDNANNAFLTGFDSTGAVPQVDPMQPVPDFTATGSTHGYLAKLNAAGSALIYSTYFGGRLNVVNPSAIALDAAGSVYIGGSTLSGPATTDISDFTLLGTQLAPFTPARSTQTGFISKISSSPSTQLWITNQPNSDTIAPGAPITYTISVQNVGDATSATLTDAPSPRTNFLSCQVSNGAACQASGKTVTAALSNIAQGETITMTVRVTSPGTSGDYNLISNTATVTSSSSSSSATALSTVRQTADIAISMTGSATNNAGTQVQFVAAVKNLGPNDSHTVVMYDTLPTSTTFVSASTTMGSCNYVAGTPGTVRCPFGNIPNGGSAQVTILLQNPQSVTLTNTATVTSQSIDPNSNNDSATATVNLTPPTYTATLVQQSPNSLSASAINIHGPVAGTSFNTMTGSTVSTPFLYQGGSFTQITTDSPSQGLGINDADSVVGNAYNGGAQQAFIYSGGKLQFLNLGSQFTIPSTGNSINNIGQIAGSATIPSNPNIAHAFLYQNGVAQDLGTLSGGISSDGYAINSRGEVTGNSFDASNLPHAFLFTNGQMLPLPGLSSGAYFSGGYGINSAGWVTGQGKNGHAFLFRNGITQDLGGLDAGDYTTGAGINDCGDVVGASAHAGGFLYTHDGVMHSLNSLLAGGPSYGYITGVAINNAGQILATATATDGFVIMTPTTPENCVPDVSITNAADASVIGQGANITYTIQVQNLTSSTSPIVVTDALAARSTLLSCTVSGGGASSCQANPAAHSIAVSFPNLPQGSSATITIQVSTPSTSGDYNLFTNTAAVTSSTGITYYSNAYTLVRETADISIAASLGAAKAGQLHYVLQVANLGPDDAHDVEAFDDLPYGTTLLSESTTMGTCTAVSEPICLLGNLPHGGSAQIDIVVQAPSGQTLTNTASVSSKSIDPNPNNNTSTVTTTTSATQVSSARP